MAALFARLGAPTVLTDAPSAEMIKYAANCFLAMKLSYVNALAEMCERLDADIADVTDGMGFDRRIGQAFLTPGPGWGGSCLPKDTNALLQVADSVDFEFRLLRATIDTNTRQYQRIVDKIRTAVTGARQGSLAKRRLAVRAHVQGGHRRPARLAGARRSRAAGQAGAELTAYDPGLPAAGLGPDAPVISVADDPYVAAKDVDAIVILTEWPRVPHARLAAAGRVDGHAHAGGHAQPRRPRRRRPRRLQLDRAGAPGQICSLRRIAPTARPRITASWISDQCCT